MSGFNGQYLCQGSEVVLKGLKPPFGAMGTSPPASGSVIRTRSVLAPTVSAFHACAGSCTPSESLLAG